MDPLDIETVEYWEKYLNGLQYHLCRREKGKYFPKLVGFPKKPIGETDLNITQTEERALRDEIERVRLYINLLKTIKKARECQS